MVRACCFILLFCSFSQNYAKSAGTNLKSIPSFSLPAVDQTAWLTKDELAALNDDIFSIAKEGKIQIGVLVINSSKPETIEQYAIRLAESWKLGKKDIDNGILIIIAKNDKEARIEVGYGLEGTITDLYSAHVLSEIMPYFKENKPKQAINLAITRIMEKVDKDSTFLQENDQVNTETKKIDPLLVLVIIISLIILMLMIGSVIGFEVMFDILWLILNIALSGGDKKSSSRGGGFGGGGSNKKW